MRTNVRLYLSYGTKQSSKSRFSLKKQDFDHIHATVLQKMYTMTVIILCY